VQALGKPFFIKRFSAELKKKKIEVLDGEALKLLMRYNGRGNIRALENSIVAWRRC